MRLYQLIGYLDYYVKMNDRCGLSIVLPGKKVLSANFNIFEVGVVQRNFINAFGVSSEKVFCVLRLSIGNDENYRLGIGKLLELLLLAEREYSCSKLSVEFEYDYLYYVLDDIYRFNNEKVISFNLKGVL